MNISCRSRRDVLGILAEVNGQSYGFYVILGMKCDGSNGTQLINNNCLLGSSLGGDMSMV